MQGFFPTQSNSINNSRQDLENDDQTASGQRISLAPQMLLSIDRDNVSFREAPGDNNTFNSRSKSVISTLRLPPANF